MKGSPLLEQLLIFYCWGCSKNVKTSEELSSKISQQEK
jgi:hypothetical protein